MKTKKQKTERSSQINRRTFVKQNAMMAVAFASTQMPFWDSLHTPSRMGVSLASYAIRWRSSSPNSSYPGFENAIDLLNHCHELGAGGIQTGVRNWSADFAGKVRAKREKLDLYLEGQISLPKNKEDISRFETEVKHAKEAGASILRTVCLSGRRYETFKSLEAFQEFRKKSIQSLEWAETVVGKHEIKLAVENHKDWRIAEMLEILKYLSSEWIGITLDTGNNLSLLEDPMKVVEAFAPHTFSIHFKDMGLEEYKDGFLLSEVPLGKGVLDLPRVVRICKNYQPDVRFNLEMITRDPLKIPCLTQQYWETFEQVPAQELANMLGGIRSQKSTVKLPLISNKTLQERLAFEEQNVRESFAYARKHLGFI